MGSQLFSPAATRRFFEAFRAARTAPAALPAVDTHAHALVQALLTARQDFVDLLAATLEPEPDAQGHRIACRSTAHRLIAEWAVYLCLDEQLLRPRLADAGAPPAALATATRTHAALTRSIEQLTELPLDDTELAQHIRAIGRWMDEHLRHTLVNLVGPLLRSGVALDGVHAALAVGRDDLLAEMADQTNAQIDGWRH